MGHPPEERPQGPERPPRERPGPSAGAAAGLVALALAVAAAAPAALRAQQRPPDRYAVERGDTLWEIAGRFLDDPFRWQEIWKENRDRVPNPDLILPGQELAIPGGEATDARPAGEAEAVAGRAPDSVPAPRASLFDAGRPPTVAPTAGISAEERPPLRPVSRGDVLGSPFLADPSELGRRGRVLGPVRAGAGPVRAWQARPGDRVRVRLRGLRVSAGDTLQAVRTGRSVGDAGRVVRPLGVLTVESVRRDTAVARVADVFGMVREDESVAKIPVPPIPTGVEFRPAEREVRARVLELAGSGSLLRDGSLVYLDAGSEDGVRPGDVFLASSAEAAGLAGDRLARLLVVRVRRGNATARVVDVGDGSVGPGARARLAERMAGSGR